MIHSYKYCKNKIKDIGKVIEVKGTLVAIEGLKSGAVGEGVVFEDGKRGMIVIIEKSKTLVTLLSRESIGFGTKAARTGEALKISVGWASLGHTVSSLGYLKDKEKQPSHDIETRAIEVKALGIDKRSKINKFLETGVSMVDLLMPLGEGQRELIIGDRKTGKSHFALQTMMHQARKGKICVYAMIGKQKSEIKRVEKFIKDKKIKNKCLIVASEAESSSGEIYLTPYTAMAIAEHFRDQGKDSLVILDDLITHAKYFREIALLSGQFPGRESYPGDIFYIHAKLLERAGNFMVDKKEVSITALPIAKTLAGDLTGYIQTNLMSVTDGHLYFDSNLFLKGIRPAVNVFVSVTRVGKQTQNQLLQGLNREVTKLLKKQDELQRYLKFGAEMTDKVKEGLSKGRKMIEFFNQSGYEDYPIQLTAILASLILMDKWDGKDSREWVEKYDNDKDFKKGMNKLFKNYDDIKKLLKALGKHEKLS
ncbi:MAG: F0F1 ATP synthase subunit alpha [Patescibacteria group bacterium]|nr:F0F1 ATP synthase subunit alpha [Patescibacteria group bacterium]